MFMGFCNKKVHIGHKVNVSKAGRYTTFVEKVVPR